MFVPIFNFYFRCLYPPAGCSTSNDRHERDDWRASKTLLSSDDFGGDSPYSSINNFLYSNRHVIVSYANPPRTHSHSLYSWSARVKEGVATKLPSALVHSSTRSTTITNTHGTRDVIVRVRRQETQLRERARATEFHTHAQPSPHPHILL